MTCPYCGSDQVICTDNETGEYECLDCHEPFREDELDEEMESDLGFLGEPDEEW